MVGSSTSGWPKRLYLLDLSRGIAALTVVFWHWQHFAFDWNAPPPNFDYTAQPLYSFFHLFYEKGDLAVDYFFQLSGFIFFWLYRDAIANGVVTLRKFAVQRFSRLYPLHLATLCLVAGLQLAYQRATGSTFIYHQNDLYHFILNLGFANLWGFEYNWSFNGPVWSVSIEILLYAGFFLAARTRAARPMVCLVIVLVNFWLWKEVDLHHQIYRGLTGFFAGGLIFLMVRFIRARRPQLSWLVYLSAIIAWSITFWPPDPDGSNHPLMLKLIHDAFPTLLLFPATIGSLALLELGHRVTLRSLSWIGDISYASYLLHFPLQLGCMLLISAGHLPRNFYYHPLSLVLFFAILIGLSWATFRGFERPMQERLRRSLG